MDKKQVRLNADKRKSCVIDFRKHCESLDTHEKEEFKQARDDAKSTIESSFDTCRDVVQRRFKLEDVAILQRLQRDYNTVNAVGSDSCFFFKVIDAPKVLDRYNDEVDKSRHFSFELDGSLDGDYGSRYGSGSSNNGKNFAYAMYREEMKAVGLNPDCNIEADIQAESKSSDQRYSRTTNPYLSQCRNDNNHFLQGGKGGTNYFQSWKDKHALYIIGTGGCRSRAIPCTDLEFAKFEMMIQAKQNVVTKHTKWIQTVVARVNRFKEVIKSMTKFSQVENFANHEKIQWKIDPEILADKFGMDLVISIDDAADSIMNIGAPKPTREEKILAWKKAHGIGLAS
jgi:hypothetical protein|tara:strand:- start:512 stop:1534 length:1023 start_codon:yes stop_codon:yes gene_type:complete